MLHHDEIDRREDLIHQVRAALDARHLPMPLFDATGDLDHGALRTALAPLGFRFDGLRQTPNLAWRATFVAADGHVITADAFSREDALAAAVISALEGLPV